MGVGFSYTNTSFDLLGLDDKVTGKFHIEQDEILIKCYLMQYYISGKGFFGV